MFFHFIVISNNYLLGHRIGWHFSSPHKLDPIYLNSFMNKIESSCGDVQFGIHKLITDSDQWESVVKKDSFFKDVVIITDPDEFINHLNRDRELSALDVAKFILSMGEMSHLKLQKIIYYAFAEYLLKYKKRMFPEKIVAFKYGPVVEEIFYNYRQYGSSEIRDLEREIFYIPGGLSGTPSMLKVLSSENGTKVVDSILEVLLNFEDHSAVDLVNKTHEKGGSWDAVYIPGANCEITEEAILKYHHIVQ
ncbi:Panacea domain-containing protein [Paenibacillus sinopodophylli]|uniref:Panacea domain-containing protein n=1 Tax=Paenibacillus sinopodophylli TaxID=1837342 RepID=UPI00110D2187|nr:type II toxin-antitoxin system antitoxin SocA domain-containing protein [Paenibacillus sinopodophylli]